MKRVVSLLLSAALLLGLLSACRKTSPDDSLVQDHTARELADVALPASGYDGEMVRRRSSVMKDSPFISIKRS